jgi:hypothetical protein
MSNYVKLATAFVLFCLADTISVNAQERPTRSEVYQMLAEKRLIFQADNSPVMLKVSSFALLLTGSSEDRFRLPYLKFTYKFEQAVSRLHGSNVDSTIFVVTIRLTDTNEPAEFELIVRPRENGCFANLVITGKGLPRKDYPGRLLHF